MLKFWEPKIYLASKEFTGSYKKKCVVNNGKEITSSKELAQEFVEYLAGWDMKPVNFFEAQ